MSLDSTLIVPEQPRPRKVPLRYPVHAWPVVGSEALPEPKRVDPALHAFARRRTRRAFGPLDDAALSALLWPVAGCRGQAESDMGFEIEHRGVPSAGAIHPIHVLICDPVRRQLRRYDGRAHALQRLECAVPQALVDACEELLPRQEGLLMLFAAEPGKTRAKYTHADTLVWRDAGVVQGAMAIAAEAVGLNFCLLGITGDPWIGHLAQQGKLVGVGAAIVGTRA